MSKLKRHLVTEAAKPKWFNDPMRFRRELSEKAHKLAQEIDNYFDIGDRYWPGDADHSKSIYNATNKFLDILDKAVTNLENEVQKAKKISDNRYK